MTKKLPTLFQMEEAVIAAGLIVKETFRKTHHFDTKSDDTVVTDTDIMANQQLLQWASRFAVDFIGEEGDGQRHWHDHIIYVDPLDGSGAFSMGLPGVSIAMTLMKKMEFDWAPVAAVIHDPLNSWTWSATIDTPTHVRAGSKAREPVHVSTDGDRKNVTICTWPGVPFELDRVRFALSRDKRYNEQAFGGLALAGGLIASGSMDATVFAGKSAAETTAMSLLVKQAGGTAADFYGTSLNQFELKRKNQHKLDFLLPNGAIIASSYELTEELVELIESFNP